VLDLGTLNPKQIEFFNSTTKFTCYGGAKGGGKSHAADRLALWYMVKYPGITVLIVRAHYPELLANHIEPILKIVPKELASYNGAQHRLTMELDDEEGRKVKSTLIFGHWGGLDAENEYQGQNEDIIIMDEATQFSERTFRFLAGGLRGDNDFPKRFYLTCNPGGVGHRWVKRLFIDRKFKTYPDDPEKTEKPEDYSFIFAKAEDNTIMLERNPSYLSDIAMMSNSPAMRHGDWSILEGSYFDNFSNETNVCKRFRIPDFWLKYRSFDYGLDNFVCCWWAVDEDGRCWCYRSYEKSNLNIPDAVDAVKQHTLPGEQIVVTYAPPDMWSRQRETGKTTADYFNTNGVPIVKSDNNRVQGHLILRTMLDPIPLRDEYVIKMLGGPEKAPKTLPQLMFFDCTDNVYEDIAEIQTDEKNPDDCAKEPHELTHSVDAVRYFCINRTLKTEQPPVEEEVNLDHWYDDDDVTGQDYETYMTGGEVTASYIGVSA
jgi:phage terminase large subunit